MRVRSIFALLLFIPSVAFASPKLLVFVVVDQMRADYLELYKDHFSFGLKRLLDEGAVFSSAHFQSVPTLTATGHATLLTGKYPEEHGIVGNYWFDRKINKRVNAVHSEKYGRGPEQINALTLGDALKKESPQSKVIAVSMKDRSAIILGGHQANAAVWFDTKESIFTSSEYYFPFPLWLREFNLKLNDMGVPGKDVGSSFKNQFLESAQADRVLAGLAIEAAINEGLGLDDIPDILAIGFSALDNLGHRVGPGAEEIKRHLIELDKILGRLFKYCDDQVGSDSYSVVLTSDHGVQSSPPKENRVFRKNLLDEMENRLQNQWQAKGDRWVLDVREPHIYLNRSLAEKFNLEWNHVLKNAARSLSYVKGVAHVYVPGQLDSDPFLENYQLSHDANRSGDLMFRFKEGVLLTSKSNGTSHGSPYDADSHVPLIFWGTSFKKGRFENSVRMVDVAPTCAKDLGFNFNGTLESKVLEGAFK